LNPDGVTKTTVTAVMVVFLCCKPASYKTLLLPLFQLCFSNRQTVKNLLKHEHHFYHGAEQ